MKKDRKFILFGIITIILLSLAFIWYYKTFYTPQNHDYLVKIFYEGKGRGYRYKNDYPIIKYSLKKEGNITIEKEYVNPVSNQEIRLNGEKLNIEVIAEQCEEIDFKNIKMEIYKNEKPIFNEEINGNYYIGKEKAVIRFMDSE